MPDAAPNGGNQRRTTTHFTNTTVVCTTAERVPAWMPDYAGMLLDGLLVRDLKYASLCIPRDKWLRMSD
jgi:hypothetical protein